MRYSHLVASTEAGWFVYEAASGGSGRCTAAWADAPIEELRVLFRHLRLLAVAGHPPDREKLQRVSLAVGRCRLDDGQVIAVHELKSKPTHWRTYYIADPATRHFHLLHTVAKKARRADPEDIRRACAVATRLRRGDYIPLRVDIPPA